MGWNTAGAVHAQTATTSCVTTTLAIRCLLETEVLSLTTDDSLAFLRKCVELCNLEANWDSYGAKPIDREVVGEAIALYLKLPYADWTPVPGSDGSVQLERHADGYDIEVYIAKARVVARKPPPEITTVCGMLGKIIPRPPLEIEGLSTGDER
jgi:hypothetical protein